MSAHIGGSGPRSNAYSQNRFTNWAEYGPWSLEIQAVFKRFDGRIAKHPKFPKIIEFDPMEGFVRPCTAQQVENQLMKVPPEFLKDLRAVFILPGTRKQLKSWNSSISFFGHYWRRCIFLHGHPFNFGSDPDSVQRFYLRDVLIHEIGHHVDLRNTTTKNRERFADSFARKHG